MMTSRLVTGDVLPKETHEIVTFEAPKLDRITLVLTDYGPNRGRVIVECFGQAWAASWGVMGERSVRRFLGAVDADYLANKLSPPKTTKADDAYRLRIAQAIKAYIDSEQTKEPQ